MKVANVLRGKGKHVTTLLDNDNVATAVEILAEQNIGAVVVEDRWQKLVGIFSERDLVRALSRDGAASLEAPISSLMSTPVITCTPDDRIEAVLARMTMNRIRHLPVLEDGRLVGIVSIGDLVHYRLDEKELEASVLLDLARLRG